MGHSVYGAGLKSPNQLKGPAHWIFVTTLDGALARFTQLSNQRVILKIDAEGFEPRIIEGANKLLQSGRVALLIWECGQAFLNEPDRGAMRRMTKFLSDLGFHHLRPISQEIAGAARSFSTAEKYHGNVFSYHPNVLSNFDQLLTIQPDDLAALNERGLLLHQQKRFEDALSVYRSALSVKPDVVEILYNCGNALLELGRFEEALASYDKTLAISPDYINALNNRGCVLQQLQRFNEALASYDKALAVAPSHPRALSNRANLLRQLQQMTHDNDPTTKGESNHRKAQASAANRGATTRSGRR
jgi:tetratricopeptide (TPR) repeat protein